MKESPDILFDKIWEKAREKAEKEYPNDPIKKQEQLQRHIIEMMTMIDASSIPPDIHPLPPVLHKKTMPIRWAIFPFIIIGVTYLALYRYHWGFAFALVLAWVLVYIIDIVME